MAQFYRVDMGNLFSGNESPEDSEPDVIRVPTQFNYSMESWSEEKGRRVYYKGRWYFFKETVGVKRPNGQDGIDILEKIPTALLAAEKAEAEAAQAKHIAEKGHECWDNAQHGYEPGGALGGDYYYCTLCNECLQVG